MFFPSLLQFFLRIDYILFSYLDDSIIQRSEYQRSALIWRQFFVVGSDLYLPKIQSMLFYLAMAFLSLLVGVGLFFHIGSYQAIPSRMRIPSLVLAFSSILCSCV